MCSVPAERMDVDYLWTKYFTEIAVFIKNISLLPGGNDQLVKKLNAREPGTPFGSLGNLDLSIPVGDPRGPAFRTDCRHVLDIRVFFTPEHVLSPTLLHSVSLTL